MRVISITDLDENACAGYHVSNISEIRLFKIINFEKVKGNYTRFYFLAGKRAINDFNIKNKTIKELNRVFSCRDNEILDMVDKFNAEKKENETKIKDITIRYCNILGPKIINETIRKNEKKYIVYKDTKEIIENLNKIIPDEYIFIGIWESGGLISSTSIHCGELLKELSKKLNNIKGGGKAERANFKGEVSVEEVTNIL